MVLCVYIYFLLYVCICTYIYILLQMTGLDIEKDQIIEMACLITDSDLNILAEVGDTDILFILEI